MSSRPRRSAAQRATEAITDMADRDNERAMASRSRRSGGASVVRGPPSSPGSSQADSGQHMHLMVKVPSSKLRQATGGGRRSSSTAAAASASRAAGSKRTRGHKKSYVVESDSDEEEDEEEEEEDEDEEDEDEEEEEEEEEEDEIEVGNRAGLMDPDAGDDDEMDEDEDAEGEEVDDMDIDAEGEDEDADGDIDMDVPPPPPAITISKPSKTGPASKPKISPPKASGRGVAVPVKHTTAKLEEEDDDDELSELESEPEGVSFGAGDEDAEGEDEEIEDVDAEGEEIEVADEDAEGEDDDELDSDDGSRAGTPDLSKLTARQRARLGDASHEYLKLSDEVQAKKVFTAEELSMRRLEMARRRRNLSEKRNEEVKMETINKLLKKQAPKTNRRHALAGDETPDSETARADPLFIRWISNKEGSRIGVPDEMVIGPAGQAFLGGRGLYRGKMVEEVS